MPGLNPALLCHWMKLMARPITALNPNILVFMATICVQLALMQYIGNTAVLLVTMPQE